MKKIGALLGVVLCSTSVLALDCQYSVEQRAVLDAEIVTDLMEVFPEKFDANVQYPCGGSLLQLATIRGNADNMEYIIEMGGADPNAMVSLKEYPIADAPETIPFPLFAAKFSPASAVIDALIEYGANFRVKDSKGHDVFWYFEQNPALRNTYLTKKGYEGLLPLRERMRRAYMAQENEYKREQGRKAREQARAEAAKAEELAKNPPRLVPVRSAGSEEKAAQ